MPNLNVKHAADCTMSFGRKDPNCERCKELLAGAPPRKWRSAIAKENDARRSIEIRDHFASQKHRTGGCGPVCTFGDW